MHRRFLKWVALGFSSLVAAVMAVTGAALGTGAGREVVVASALRYANNQLRGSLTVDSLAGSLWGGLEARGLRLVGEDGGQAVSLDSLRLRYRVRDFLSRRIVLGQLALYGPSVTLEEREDGRLNLEHILKAGESEGTGRTPPLIAFQDVDVQAGMVRIRTRAGPAGDQFNERTIELPAVRFAYLQLASPFAGESGIVADVVRLNMKISDPALDVRNARGEIRLIGDSIALDLDRVELANSQSTLRGTIYRLSDGPWFDLTFDADRITPADIRAFVPSLPAETSGRGRFRVATRGDDQTLVAGSDITVVPPLGGRVRGDFGFLLGPGDEWAAQGVDLTTQDFKLSSLDWLLDSIPFAGWITGRTVANGPRGRLSAEIDWAFRDQQADDAVSELQGGGTLSLGVTDDIVFRRFALRRARVALATVRNLVPAVQLIGTLDAVGTIDGPRQNVEFSGALRHTDDTLPATVARGVVRLDSRRDTVGVWANLIMDSLQVEGLRPSYPAIPLMGALAGEIRLAGYADSLEFDARLEGLGGRVGGNGNLSLVESHVGGRNLDLNFAQLVLHGLDDVVPTTRFTGGLQGTIEFDTLTPPLVDLGIVLTNSLLGGIPVDSARVRLRVRDSLLVADTLSLWGAGISAVGYGELAMRAPRSDSIVIGLQIDSLHHAVPLMLQLAERPPLAETDTLAGRVSGKIIVRGALDEYVVAGALAGSDLRWNNVVLPTARGRWLLNHGTRRELAVTVEVDSVIAGDLAFSAIEAAVSGNPDSLRWTGFSRMGEDGAMLIGGRSKRDSTAIVLQFDSTAVLLASNVWFLQRGARVTISDSAVDLHTIHFATASGGSTIEFDGAIPRQGPGHLAGSIVGLSVKDLWALRQLDAEATSGVLSGTFELGGSARAPIIDLDIGVQGAVFNEFRMPQTQGSLSYRDRRLGGAFTFHRSGEQVLDVELDLPIDLALRGAGPRQLPGPLSVRARAERMDLTLINAINPQIRNASGELSADFGIAGTWEVPELTGFVAITNGAASFPSLGVRHEQMNGRVALSSDTIYVERFRVQSGRGSAQLDGFLWLEGLTRPELDLAIRAQEFRAITVPDFLTLTASGEIGLHGPVFGATLTGEGTITQGVVHFADIIEKEIISLEEEDLDAETVALIRRQGLGRNFENRFLDSLRIENLSLGMGADVRLRSTEANIQLTGQLTVSKAGEQYRIDGTLQTPRGTYQLPLGPTITKDFNVTRGEVRYFGTPDLNAALDIDARHQLRSVRGDPVVVSVNVGGTINEPRLTLSSDVRPPLSDTEIISYLIFGAPSAQAAGAQFGSYGLEQTAANIAGRITGQFGSTLISDLGIPLDFFEVRPEFGNSAMGLDIALGRQIGERWFLTVSPRICRHQTFTVENLGASVEFRMSQQWRLSASADPLRTCLATGAQGSELRYQLGIDLLWEKSY